MPTPLPPPDETPALDRVAAWVAARLPTQVRLRPVHLILVGAVWAVVSFLLTYRPNDAQRIGELPRIPAFAGMLMLPGGDRPFFIARSMRDAEGLPEWAGMLVVLPGLPGSLLETRATGTARIVNDDLFYVEQVAAAAGTAAPSEAGTVPQELRRLPLSGGPPTRVAAGHWTNPVLGEHFLYWTEPAGDRNGPWDLKAMALSGGEPRILYRGPVPVPQALGESVCWTVQAEGFPPRRELVLYNESDGSQTRLPDPGSTPVEASDRLYWVDDSLQMGMAAPETSSAGIQQALARWALISTDLKGGNRRRIPFPRDRGASRVMAHAPVEHRGDLYCSLDEYGGPPSSGWMHTTLLRYRPGTRAHLEPLRRLSSSAGTTWFLSGPWVYYAVLEDRETWFHFSPRGLESRKVPVLYRGRLPD